MGTETVSLSTRTTMTKRDSHGLLSLHGSGHAGVGVVKTGKRKLSPLEGAILQELEEAGSEEIASLET